MQTDEWNKEQVSDLADGRLRGQALTDALSRLGQDDGALRVWNAYHVVGDVLRTPDLAQGHDAAFLKRLRLRLRDETIEPPRVAAVEAATAAVHVAASNDAFFNWVRLGAAASVVAVAGLGWMLLDGRGKGDMGATLVQAPAPVFNASAVATTAGEGVMLRDPRLDQFIQAHRQAAGGSALQVPAGFLRNATYDLPMADAAQR